MPLKNGQYYCPYAKGHDKVIPEETFEAWLRVSRLLCEEQSKFFVAQNVHQPIPHPQENLLAGLRTSV